MLEIDLKQIEAGRVHLTGTLPPSFMGLQSKDLVKISENLTYDLLVELVGDDVFIEGTWSMPIRLNCCKCAEWFDEVLNQTNYNLHVPVEKTQSTVDIGPFLREDVILEFPAYPHCDSSSFSTKKCSSIRYAGKEGENSTNPNLWDNLDKLDLS